MVLIDRLVNGETVLSVTYTLGAALFTGRWGLLLGRIWRCLVLGRVRYIHSLLFRWDTFDRGFPCWCWHFDSALCGAANWLLFGIDIDWGCLGWTLFKTIIVLSIAEISSFLSRLLNFVHWEPLGLLLDRVHVLIKNLTFRLNAYFHGLFRLVLHDGSGSRTHLFGLGGRAILVREGSEFLFGLGCHLKRIVQRFCMFELNFWLFLKSG